MTNTSSFSDWQIILLIIPYFISFAISAYLLWSDRHNAR